MHYSMALVITLIGFIYTNGHQPKYSYVFGFPSILGIKGGPFITVTCVDAANVHIESRDINFDFVLSRGHSKTFDNFLLDSIDQLGGFYTDQAFLITSNVSLSIVAGVTGADAFHVLPSVNLGEEYYVVTGGSGRTQFMLVNGEWNKENLVTVSILEKGEDGRVEREEQRVVLNGTGRVCWVFVSEGDLTGTRIHSQYPVAVISGRRGRPREQGEQERNNGEAEMMPTLSSWGTLFPLFHSHCYRLLAAYNSTQYSLTGTSVGGSLDSTENVNLAVHAVTVLNSSEPVLLVQWPCDRGGTGFYWVVPPLEQYSSHPVLLPFPFYHHWSIFTYDRQNVLCRVLNRPQFIEIAPRSVETYEYYTQMEFKACGDVNDVVLCSGTNFTAISYGLSYCDWSSAETAEESVEDILEELNGTTVTDAETAEVVLAKLHSTLSLAGNVTEKELQLVTATLVKCASVYGLSNTSWEHYIHSMDIVLDQDEWTVQNSSVAAQLLLGMSILASNVDTVGVMTSKNLAMAIGVNGLVEMADGTVSSIHSPPSPINQLQAFVYLPNVQRRKRSIGTTKMSFTIYRNHKLFSGENRRDRQKCDVVEQPRTNYVITANIGQDNGTGLQHHLHQPIQMAFRSVQTGLALLHARIRCAYWNASQWPSDGCWLQETHENLHICHCNHLTDFTLIVDLSEEDPALCDPSLSIFTTVLSIMSITALSLALLLCLLVSILNHHRYPPTLSEPLMAASLFFLFLFFLLSDSNRLGLSPTACRHAAVLLYVALLVQLCWAALAGLSFFKTYYVVLGGQWLHRLTARRTGLIVSLIFPPLIVSLLWTTKRDLFHRNDQFCWIRPDQVGLAVLLPLSLFLMADLLLTMLLVNTFFCRSSTATIQHRKIRLIAQKCVILLTVQVILAFPWMWQYLTIWTVRVTASHYIFSFAHGSQGLLLAAIYIFVRIRKLYRNRTAQASTTRIKWLWSTDSSRRLLETIKRVKK